MAAITVTASSNINAVAYATGDSLTLNNSVNAFVRLTVDAQVAADVTKVEAALPISLSLSNVNAEYYVVNTSVTVPLVVKFSGENNNVLNGPAAKFKVRGAWIDLQNGDGTNGQTIDFNTKCLTASGVKIDWPPFVQVEVEAGSGALIAVDPTAGATYQLGGAGTTYTVVSADITAGKGTITVTGAADPSANQGKLVKASGTGDTNIGLRYWQKIGSQYIFHVGEAYVTMLNIGGTYNDITPTAYPFKKNLTDCGTTLENGHFFEWSEQNHTLYFGSAVTGGWVPPNGANIRIPNIHFTGTAIPNATAGSRVRVTSLSSVFDFEICSFSNRWSLTGSQLWPQDLRLIDVGGVFNGSSPFSYMNGTLDIDGLYSALDLYSNSRPGPALATVNGAASVSNVVACTVNSAQPINLSGMSSIIKLGILRGTQFSKTTSFSYAVRMDAGQAEVGKTGGQLTVGPFYCNGGSLYFQSMENCRIHGLMFSDTTTGVASATNTCNWITGALNLSVNITIERFRLIAGGCPSKTNIIANHTSRVTNLAIKDATFDTRNPQTLATWQQAFGIIPGSRYWLGRIDLANTDANFTVQSGGNGYLLSYPARFSEVLANPARSMGAVSGMMLEGVEATIAATSGLYDVSPFHLLRTTGKTVGTLYFYPAVVDQDLEQISASGGTAGVDFFITTTANIPVTGVTLEYTGVRRIRGVLKEQASATATFNGISPTTGVTHKLRFRKYGETTWPSYTTITSGADFLTAWAAMQGYATYTPTIGFEAQYQVATTTSVAGRYVSSVEFKLLDLDSSVEVEVGYIQIGYTGATDLANVAILDYTNPAAPVQMEYVTADSTGAYNFEYPYNFDGAPVSVRVIGRKAGYNESFVDASVYQQGKSVPLALVASEACTDAAVSGVAFDGATSTCTITLDATLADLYQAAQYQAHQSGSMIYPVPVTSNGVQGYTTVYDVTVGTTKKLNGAGTLTLGSKILSTEFASGTDYAYTGGTFSQLTTVPTFAGGTLSPAAVLTSADAFTMSSGTVEMATTSTAWDLSGATFTGTLNLRTDTGSRAVTVLVPAGTTVDTTGESAITVNYTTVTRGLDFGDVSTGSTVKVFATGTQTVIATPTGPTWLWSEAGGTDVTVDYTIQKAGYDPIRVTGVTVNSAVLPVAVQQQVARAYVASSGLAFATNCFANPTTKLFGLTAASTLQNFYSRMIESWITEATLQNKPFPIVPSGPNSFTLTDGWDWDLTTYPNSIALLSRDGMRRTDAGGSETDVWAAILSVGVPAGFQVRFQQQDGLGTTNAQNTGNIDQLIKIKKTGTGAFDYTGWLVLKCQEEGYDQAEAIAADIYGTLEDQLYVFGLTPLPNGIAAGAVDATVTVTAEPTPVEWPAASGKFFSTTITDTTDSHSGLEIMQAVRAENEFNWSDLIRPNGAKFKTVTGNFYGDAYATPAGVRVVKADGVTPHPDFDLFGDDSGSNPYVPPVVAPIEWAGALDGTTVLLYNDVGGGAGVIIDTQTISGAGGYSLDVTLPSVDVAVGDPLRIRFGHKSYYAGELQGTMTETGLTFVGDMTLHQVYAAWGFDGAVYDQGYTPPGPYVMDGTNLQVDIAAGSTTGLKTQLGAWTQYLMTLPAGLAAFYGAWDLLAVNQIRQNVDVVDVKIDVPTAGALFEYTDNNVNYYRSDFTFPGNVEAGHGLIAMTYNASIFVPPPTIISGESVVTGTPETVADAVRTELATELADITKARKLAQNKKVLDPATGVQKVYDDDGATVLGQGNAYMDADGTQLYDGTAPVHRTERLT